MSKLSELLLSLCPNGVEKKALCEIACINRGKRVVKKDLSEEGEIPVFQNSLTPLGFYDQANNPAQTCFIIIAGAAGDMGYSETPFWAADDCLAINCGEKAMSRFLFHVLSSQQPYIYSQVRRSSIPRLPRKVIDDLMVPVPPLEVQAEIVRILDNFTGLTAELTAELTARNAQYEHYRRVLLSDSIEVVNYRLKDIAEIGTGNSNTNEAVDNGIYPFFVRSQSPLKKNDYSFDETAIITAGDGVGVGKVFHYYQGKYALHQRAYRIHIISKAVIPKYVFYYFQSEFYDYILKAGVHSSVSSIRKPMLDSFVIPVPNIQKQRQIVEILDSFSTLCSDANKGLPREIEARQKQYEYYRDKLLSFPESKQ